MGSEKKRKRSSTDPPTGEMAAALAKAERKRLKKARREAIENHEALVDSGVSKNEIAPLVSPVASRTLISRQTLCAIPLPSV